MNATNIQYCVSAHSPRIFNAPNCARETGPQDVFCTFSGRIEKLTIITVAGKFLLVPHRLLHLLHHLFYFQKDTCSPSKQFCLKMWPALLLKVKTPILLCSTTSVKARAACNWYKCFLSIPGAMSTLPAH